MKANDNYIHNLAKQHDYDRYICSLFAPEHLRKQLWGLIALGCELMRIPQLVSEEMVGLVRLKWWQEQLEATANGASPTNPILQYLQQPLTQNPAILQASLALCEAVAETLGTNDLNQIKQIMRHYFALLAHGTNEAEAIAQYQLIAEYYAQIAAIRLQLIEFSQLPEITIAPNLPPYLNKLHLLAQIWRKHLQKSPEKSTINYVALKLCCQLFIFYLRK